MKGRQSGMADENYWNSFFDLATRSRSPYTEFRSRHHLSLP